MDTLPWFVVVMFQLIASQHEHPEAYIMTQPKFLSAQTCVEYIDQSSMDIVINILQDMDEIPTIEHILCIHQEELHHRLKDKRVMDQNKGIAL